MRTCPTCGLVSPSSAERCPADGTQLPLPVDGALDAQPATPAAPATAAGPAAGPGADPSGARRLIPLVAAFALAAAGVVGMLSFAREAPPPVELETVPMQPLAERPAPQGVGRLAVEDVEVRGGLDPERTRQAVRGRIAAMSRCPVAGVGKAIRVTLAVEASGRVMASFGDGDEAVPLELVVCVDEQLQGLQLQPTADGRSARVVVTLQPTE